MKFDPDNRPYVVEQTGRVWRLNAAGGKSLFLDIHNRSSKISGYSERGLLDIAFPPGFPKDARVLLHYTDRRGDTVLSQLRVAKGAADEYSETILLREKQPYSNHNGGQIEFGPDGFLYFALGDGGSAGDPHGNGQNLGTRLGKLLRLDVASGTAVAPASNPFAKQDGAKPEIWAWGLRNPWRFSFDGAWLYIADVGQNKWEEVDVEDVALGGGRNYGWNLREGDACFRKKPCEAAGLTAPVLVYPHEHGDCSITGGYVYRGKAFADLQGLYFYSDYCTGCLASFRFQEGKAVENRDWPELNPGRKAWGQVSSLGRDRDGELYIVSYDRGSLSKLVLKK